MIDTSYTLEKLKLDKKKLKLDWQHTTNIRRAVKNFKVNYTDWLELSTRHFQTSNSPSKDWDYTTNVHRTLNNVGEI